MRIEGIRFESKIAWVKSTGKTGNTDAKPLVIACEPLLQWLKHHPYGGDPDAPVWWSYRTKSVVSLAYLERLVKKAAIYKPTTSHQNIPLQFTVELVDYIRSDFLDDSSQQTFPSQNESPESINDFEDVLLNNTIEEDTGTDYVIDNNKLNVTTNFEENNSTESDYLDVIDLEKLFEMFLNEHFGDNTDEQILNYTVFLDFLNKTDSAIIDSQNFTEIQS